MLHKWIETEFPVLSDDAANYELIIEPVKDKSFFEFIDKQLIIFNLWYSADSERAQFLSRSVIGKWKVWSPSKFEFFTLKSFTSKNYSNRRKWNYLRNFMYFSLLFQCLVISHIIVYKICNLLWWKLSILVNQKSTTSLWPIFISFEIPLSIVYSQIEWLPYMASKCALTTQQLRHLYTKIKSDWVWSGWNKKNDIRRDNTISENCP